MSDSRPKQLLMETLLGSLDSAGLSPCVVSEVLDGEINVESDVDVIISGSIRHAVKLIRHVCREKGAGVVNMFRHSGGGTQVLIVYCSEALNIDLYSRYWRGGNVFVDFNYLRGCRKIKSFSIPDVDFGFFYLLVKRSAKANFRVTDYERLKMYLPFLKRSSIQISALSRALGNERLGLVLECLQEGHNFSEKQIYELRYCFERKLSGSLPYDTRMWLLNRIEMFPRLVNRIARPTGLMVAFLGPDGSGKSSVIEAIRPILAPYFRGYQYYHLRPRIGYKVGETSMPVSNPHEQRSRSMVASMLKDIYFLADYTVGYSMKVLPRLLMGKLVIFDRYYDDVLVDPRRYRHASPKWVTRLFVKLAPRPDMVIILNAPPEVVYKRKQEVAYDETVKQCGSYVQLANELCDSCIVDASNSVTQVAYEVSSAIISVMEERLG